MNTYYFSHDYTARSDSKIKELLYQHGITGYGIYWCLIEDLYLNANALPFECGRIAHELRTDKSVVESIIKDFDLFEIKDGFFSSQSVQKRLDKRNDKSEKASLNASKRWKNANALPNECDGNAIKESKVKESKVNKRKLKEEVVFIPPVLNDVLVYFDENGYSKEAATKAFNYYTNLGWKNSKGNQVINWKNTMQNWFTPENEKKKYHLYPKLMN
jgi:hypothetical protein